ncbi:DUF2878 domain-containing protein [Endozoicomonas sp.]|nr:DUF2878 domain-containing protein [Endozoicomonas sp.]
MANLPWKSVVNALLFQAGWFACVLGGNTLALIATGLILIIHLSFITQWKKEREILAVTLLLGSAVDSFLGHIGVLIFNNNNLLLPLWLACLWLLFSTTLRHCLIWTEHYRLAGALVGAIAGPLSYYAGTQLSDVELALPSLAALTHSLCHLGHHDSPPTKLFSHVAESLPAKLSSIVVDFPCDLINPPVNPYISYM